jgi:hypothetical protein
MKSRRLKMEVGMKLRSEAHGWGEVICLFETVSHYLAQTGLELSLKPPPQSPECRCVSLHPAG